MMHKHTHHEAGVDEIGPSGCWGRRGETVHALDNTDGPPAIMTAEADKSSVCRLCDALENTS